MFFSLMFQFCFTWQMFRKPFLIDHSCFDPLALSLVDVTFRLDGCRIFVNCETHTDGKTGVEMEAIIGVQAACATIYDMCKAVQRDIVIRRVRLLYKDGGRSGVFRAPDMPLD